MSAPAALPPSALPVAKTGSCPSRGYLREVIDRVAHLLPTQGPITEFVAQNILQAFEDLPFDHALVQASKVLGCQPYLDEERYRTEMNRGRIRFSDVQAVLKEDLGTEGEEKIFGTTSCLDLRLAMLQYSMQSASTEELLWFVAEKDSLRRVRTGLSAAACSRLVAETRRWLLRDLRGAMAFEGNGMGPGNGLGHGNGTGRWREQQPFPWLVGLLNRFGDVPIEDWKEETWISFALQALWRICCDGVAEVPEFSPSPVQPIRHRDLLLQRTREDPDLYVHELLVRFCAAFLDQGCARWTLPGREQGFYACFLHLYGQTAGPPDRWMVAVRAELQRLKDARISPLECVQESLEDLGVPAEEWASFLAATLLALPGWAGMIRQVEERADRVRHPVPGGSLVEFLAIRLVLDRFAAKQVAQEFLDYAGPLAKLRSFLVGKAKAASPGIEPRAFRVFHLAQALGWLPGPMSQLTKMEWIRIVREIEEFSQVERCRVFHRAYERRFVTQSLDALALHPWTTRREQGRARFQASFCLDEREESIRRHLEELAPDVETFGAAGFYGVAMYYRGAADAHFVPLCPIVIRPQHWVTEQVDADLEKTHQRRAQVRRALGNVFHRMHLGSRTFVLGAILTAGVGVLASIPLIARVIFPRLTSRIRQVFGRFVQPPPKSQLQLERRGANPGPEGDQVGFSVLEMTDMGERFLREIGLTSNLARLVFINGHGSNSQNNPHKSAYDCGACGGRPGAPNGRALAQILNDPRVRTQLKQRGLSIPTDTWFVGGIHNTCNETIEFFDLEKLPATHLEEFDRARRDFEAALARNAHERCRRFYSAPLTINFEQAREHVEARSEDLAQTRPEMGHQTNALCILGRRERTRGLFLDRRAFLVSYDPTQDDPQAAILTRLLSAAVPVCSGINLTYFFSHVDNRVLGAGSKLPHNVTSLLGVMDGAASDLRTGLPWQMVEIHEPVRLLFIIETTPEILIRIMDHHPTIGRMFRNGWCQLAVQDPSTGRLQLYHDGLFEPYHPEASTLPHAATSYEWYRGWRDHLEFAEIGG